MNGQQRLLRRPFFIRLLHWEYWSFGAVYAWVYPVWVLLAIRARSFFFFAASNPKIRNGGFLCESKKDIHNIMDERLYPRTIHFDIGTNAEQVLNDLKKKEFNFPLIGKPDTGGRGRGIKLLENEQDCIAFVNSCLVDFHIQQYISYKNEVGIFYYRLPGEQRGRITGVVRKEFLSVTGNGASTIRELISNDNRAVLQMSSLQNVYGDQLEFVLPAGEKKLLVPYGNHARGAKFLDDTHLADEQLTEVVNNICSSIDEFYFGRLDIKYDNWEDFKNGRNFSVIEVNGAGAEPTHMYDPRHSIFFAWKEIARHWFILNRVSIMNHKRGVKYLTVKQGLKMFRDDKEHSRKLLLMKE
jgi:hypothetical protein